MPFSCFRLSSDSTVRNTNSRIVRTKKDHASPTLVARLCTKHITPPPASLLFSSLFLNEPNKLLTCSQPCCYPSQDHDPFNSLCTRTRSPVSARMLPLQRTSRSSEKADGRATLPAHTCKQSENKAPSLGISVHKAFLSTLMVVVLCFFFLRYYSLLYFFLLWFPCSLNFSLVRSHMTT